MFLLELEYLLVGKDITYRMLLYLFVYFLRKITTNKHAILFTMKLFPCYLPMVKVFSGNIRFPRFLSWNNSGVCQVAKLNSKSDNPNLLNTKKMPIADK